jgi:hypothetical protein
VLGCHLAGAGAGAALEPVVAALAADADAATLARRLAAPAAAADPFAEELVAQARELG